VRNSIEVSQEEMNRAIMQEAQRYPGQEREVIEFFQKNENALYGLRAPLFEDKVVDYILELAKVTEKPGTIEDLMRDPADDDQPKKAGTKKSAGKKTEAKKSTAKKSEPAPKKPAASKSKTAKDKS
jgi:trigger factor